MATYFSSEDEIRQFIHKVNDYKEFEAYSLGWHNLEQNETLSSRPGSNVPTRQEISKHALLDSSNNAMLQDSKAYSTPELEAP